MKTRVQSLLIKAKKQVLEGRREEALENIKKALALDPGEITITEVLISLEQIETHRVQHEANLVVNVKEENTNIERNANDNMDSKLEKIFNLSDEALKAGNDSKALAYLKKAVQLFPNEEIAQQKFDILKNQMKAIKLVKIGLKKLSEGDTKKAVIASRRAFNLLPEVKDLNKLLSMIESKNINSTEQEADIDIDMDEEPEVTTETVKKSEPASKISQAGEALLWADRIRTAVKDDNFEEAGKMVIEAVKRHPNDELLDSFYSKLKRLGFVKVK